MDLWGPHDPPPGYFRWRDLGKEQGPTWNSPTLRERYNRASLNWEVWVHPDERMERPFWYMKINQRRRLRPGEHPWRKFVKTLAKTRKRDNSFYKHYEGTQQFYEALAKGEKPSPVYPEQKLPNNVYLTPRERRDTFRLSKLRQTRIIGDSQRVASFMLLDAHAREPTLAFPHIPLNKKQTRRLMLQKMLPTYWVPRLVERVQYAMFKGRMPPLMRLDLAKKYNWRSFRLEARKYMRTQQRLHTLDPKLNFEYSGWPRNSRFTRYVLPIWHRLNMSLVQPLIYPMWGKLFRNWLIVVPVTTTLAYGTVKAFMNTDNILQAIPPDFREKAEAIGYRYGTGDKTEEDLKRDHYAKYPRPYDKL